MPRTIPTPNEPVETPMFPVTIFVHPAFHGTLCTLPGLYAAAGRPMASIGDALRAALMDTVEALTGRLTTPGAA